MSRASTVVITVLILSAHALACGADDPALAGSSSGSPGPDGGAPGPGGGGPDGSTSGGSDGGGGSLPEAKGDPCRGQPLPADQHFVPPGMCARLVSARVSGLRQLHFAPNGDMFGTTGSTVWLFRDDDEDGFFTREEIHEWAKFDGNGNNSHLDVAGGYLYAGSRAGVRRYAWVAGELKGGPGEDVVVGQPNGPSHPLHTTHVYDGWLYVASGSGGNAAHESGNGSADYDTKRSLIKRFDLSKFVPGAPFQWDAGEVFTVGLRNANGFTRNETTKKMYAVVNGLDNQRYGDQDVKDDNPGEQVVELGAGKRYGYPFCFTAQRVVAGAGLIAPGTQLRNPSFQQNPHDDAWCAANSEKPATFLQAHSAPLDLVFFDVQPTGALPEKYRGGAFIAMHGSWNRSAPTGHKVVWQPFAADGTTSMPTSTETTTTFPYETVFGGGDAGGPQDGPWSWSDQTAGEGPRPAGVAISPIDGALYIASDESGYVYRVGVEK